MLPTRLDSIDEGHLNALVNNGVRESRSFEFKAKLVWGTESERKEFLADVSALANGGGGDLIFGIEEENGTASAVVGLDSFDPDDDTLKMESVIRDGIAPRIIGIRLRPVDLNNGRRVVIGRVPNSLNRPHMVVLKNWSRFYSRNSAGKYQLDVHELRSAFVASESVHGAGSSVPDRENRCHSTGEHPRTAGRKELRVYPHDPDLGFRSVVLVRHRKSAGGPRNTTTDWPARLESKREF